MAAALGLAAALAYGLSDFIAGLASRRASFVLVAVIGNAMACVVTLAVLVPTASAAPAAQAALWGAASGVGSALGTLALYRGLGRGRMGVVAPLSALGAAIVPTGFGVVLGERPSLAAWSGIALAMPAIWLVSKPQSEDTGPAEGPASAGTVAAPAVRRSRLAVGVADGLLAGLGFALLFVALDLAGDASGLWPVATGQIAALVVLLCFGLATRGGRRAPVPRRAALGAVSTGVLGATATILYFLSTQAGLLAIVAVLTSLYPAVTVLLAALALREPVTPSQGLGLALAGSAVALIVLG